MGVHIKKKKNQTGMPLQQRGYLLFCWRTNLHYILQLYINIEDTVKAVSKHSQVSPFPVFCFLEDLMPGLTDYVRKSNSKIL